jgi:hypothetical protein
MGNHLARHFLQFVAAGLLLGLPWAPARAAESLDNCAGNLIVSLPAVITRQGTWCFSKDLATAISSGAAIQVNTNNVTLDCNDFKLGGTAAGPGTAAIGVLAEGRLGVTIRRCNIRGFGRGVWLEDGANALLEDNAFFGITSTAIGLQGVDTVLVRRNRIGDTGNVPVDTSPGGIVVISGSGVVVSDNVVSGVVGSTTSMSFAWGIRIENVGATVSENRIFNIAGANGGTGTGILLGAFGKAIGNTIDNVTGTGSNLAIECSFGAVARDNLTSRVANVASISGCVDGGGNVSL